MSTAGVTSDVVVELVRRTTAASGVPERLEDEAAAAYIADLLRGPEEDGAA